MKPNIFFSTRFSPLTNFITIISFFLLANKASCTVVDPKFVACNIPKTCGDGQNISFPFYIQGEPYRFCGYPGFHLSCNKFGKPILKLNDNDYIVHKIFYQNQSILVSNSAILLDKNTSCTNPPIQNLSLPAEGRFHLFNSTSSLVVLYNCNSSRLANDSKLSNYKVDCADKSTRQTGSTVAMLERNPLLDYASEKCKSRVVAPVADNIYEGEDQKVVGIQGMLERGFVLNWTASNCSICEESGGKCGFNETTYLFKCFCPDRPHASDCKYGNNKLRLKLGIGLGIGCPFIGIILCTYIFWSRFRKKRNSINANNSSSDPSSKVALEEDSVYFGIPVFSYAELEEATNNFDSDEELGDGGFGTVYYGKLKDGREVAVKRLYEHNYKRVTQFMTEIEILTRLRHKNLVCLYGCTSRRSRELLLVYEYIPNGTVADHLHGDKAKSTVLAWPIRMSIAIETASALAYLHASEIVHRDVKTNNILLDDNFCVKVADFGLSRLFPNDVTHVLTAPQGTPGYVDPEYHQCYQLTAKSDVYSFGVVLIELISSMPAVDITRHQSEINLSNFAISKIQKCAFDELIDSRLGYNSDEEVTRMTTSVAELAFQCLQQDKAMRPSMDDVLGELKRIQGGESKENQEEVHDDNTVFKSTVPPASPPYCDQAALLKNIRLPPSPDSVTNKWISSSTATNESS